MSKITNVMHVLSSDLEWLLTWVSRSRWFLKANI